MQRTSENLVLDTRGSGNDATSFKAIAFLTVRRVIAYIVLVILALMSLFTIYILIINSTRSHSEIQTSFSLIPGKSFGDNFMLVVNYTKLPIFRSFLNSFIIAVLSATLCTYFSALTAYGIHMYDFKLKKPLFAFILMVMMVPGQVGAIGLVKMCSDLHITDSDNPIIFYMPLILPSIASPIVFFYMKQYLESILPKEMVEAARVDGAGEIRIFHQMVLPILKPALAIQFIFAFVASWNNYFVPQLLLSDKPNMYKTIPMVLELLNDNSNPATFDLGRIYVIMLFAIIPLLIVYLIFSKFIMKNLTSGSVKG